MVIKVITYSNVLFINILLFILDSRSRRLHDFIFDVLIRTFLNFIYINSILCFNFDYHKSLISYLYSLYYYEIFLPCSIIRNNGHTTQCYTVSLIY